MKENLLFERLLMTVAFFVTVFSTYEFQLYRLYAWESAHLFLFDTTYCIETLSQTGGGTLLVASFLTQFFKYPLIGLFVVSFVYLSIVLLLCAVGKKMGLNPILKGCVWIPVGFMFLCVENDYYRFQGHIAFFLAMLALWGYVSMREMKLFKRYLLGTLSIVLLYHCCGSVVWLYVLGMMLYDVKCYGRKAFLAFIYIPVFLCVAFLSVKLSLVDGVEKAFLPALYYDYATTYFFPCYAWVSLVVVWIILSFTAIKKLVKSVYLHVLSLISFLCAILVTGNMYIAVHSDLGYKIWIEQYHAERQEWEDIVDLSDEMTRNHFICYLHLALAQQGKLPERLPHYRVFDESSIYTPSAVERVRHALLGTVYYYWMDIDAAYRSALAANKCTPGGCHPEQMKILVYTSLVRGEYALAEECLDTLEKTLNYAEWAKENRRFLSNPETMRQDPLLRDMLQTVSVLSGKQYRDATKQRMKDILDANPSNQVMEQFYIAYLMLGHGG